jgi:hypothetical protein
MFELLQNSDIVILFFFRHETEDNIKCFMQDDLIEDDHQRHFIAIDFICAIHDENFIINLQDALRTFLCKKKMSYLIETIFLKSKRSVILIQLMH